MKMLKYKTDLRLVVFIFLFLLFNMFILKPAIVISESMLPEYSLGSMNLVLKVMPFEKLETGDVIEYEFDKKYITHRIVKIKGNTLICKGDNNKKVDPVEITKERYNGKVVLNVKYIGSIITFLQKHIDIIVILIFLIYVFFGKGRKDGNNTKI